MTATDSTLDGSCTCGRIRYRLNGPPLFVHACHCRWCQRETGASFALDALIETDRVAVLEEPPTRLVSDEPSKRGGR